MDWKELGKKVAGLGLPALGASLGGPAGGALGTIIASTLGLSDATPESIAKAVATNPDNIVKLRELEVMERIRTREIDADESIKFRQADSADISTVNASIQAESKSEHWPQWSWRPSVGFAVAFDITALGVTVVASYGYAMVSGITRHLELLPGMLTAMATVLAIPLPILGIASWWRGKQKIGG